jgi:acetyltransferase-like isoleucine patch superfamily enzyme
VRRAEVTPPIFHQPCSINSPAFAYEKGELLPSPFACEIADDVEIMPFAVVQRGNVRPTRIGARTKIDHGVLVGHDVQIGEDCTIAAHAVIAGHVTIEENCYLGIGCLVKQRVRIGKHAMIGAGAVVLHDVPPGLVVVGNPARVLRVRFKGDTDCTGWAWGEEAKKWRKP